MLPPGLQQQFEGNMPKPNGAVQAAPAMYIDVIINGKKQVYDVQTALELRNALNQALQPMDQALAAQEQKQEDPETPEPSDTPTPDDQSPPTPESDEPVEGEDSHPDA